MKAIVTAGQLANAAELAAFKKGAIARLVTRSQDEILIIAADSNVAVTAAAPATIIDAGEASIAADRLAALLGGFHAEAIVSLSATARFLSIACGDGRYRLPLCTHWESFQLEDGAPSVMVSADDALHLFSPLIAAEDGKKPRPYLAGLYLHHAGGKLHGVSTDGTTLLRASVDAGELPGSNLPAPSIAAMARLIKKAKPDSAAFRRGERLFEVAAPGFNFVTRLIGERFPSYECVLPPASRNVATVSRAELRAALARLEAVAVTDTKLTPLVALSWKAGKPIDVFLVRELDAGVDTIGAGTTGAAQIAFALPVLAALIDEFSDESLRLEIEQSLIIRTSAKLGLLVSCKWQFAEAQALSA
jgi:hypothetical protein